MDIFFQKSQPEKNDERRGKFFFVVKFHIHLHARATQRTRPCASTNMPYGNGTHLVVLPKKQYFKDSHSSGLDPCDRFDLKEKKLPSPYKMMNYHAPLTAILAQSFWLQTI